MIPALRTAFNESWTEKKYRDLVHRLEARTGATLGFPSSETPGFLPRSLMATLAATGLALLDQILGSPGARAEADAVVPERFQGINAEVLPTFAQVDFGLVRDADGAIKPKLVELQAF